MTLWDDQTRRQFLWLTGAGLTGALVGCTQTQKEANSTDSSSNTKSAPNGEDASTGCASTDDDTQGPFYRENVPIRTELDLYGDAGSALTLSGQVLDPNCNPIANAIVDIWHADPTTIPVNELTNADSVDYDHTSDEMRYRGQTATDAEGRYSFHTKKPGWYLNGDTFRPMHIHVKVWVGNTEKLTTQLYFVGDPYIEGDPWASLDRAVTLSPHGDGAEKGSFDFIIT